MARPPLPIGGHGKVRFSEAGPGRIIARCQYRDSDGRTRQVEATGKTEPAAERELKKRLADRAAPAADDITGDTRLRVAAERWYATITAAAEAGERSPSTAAAYRGLLDRHILPSAGEWRLREATTGKVDRVLLTIREKSGAPTAKSCRTVLSGVLSYAARQDAISAVATRNTSPIPTKPKREPRALTVEEVARWLQQLSQDETAIRHDMLDLTAWLLATGVRSGEALAVSWEDVDLIGQQMVVNGAIRQVCTVKVDWTIIRITGKGLLRKKVKTTAGLRTLRLPEFAVTMLRRRAVERYVLATGVLPGGFVHVATEPISAGQRPSGQGFVHSVHAEVPEREHRGDAVTSANTAPGDFVHSVHASEVEKCEPAVDLAAVVAHLAGSPVFPDTRGGWRDPANTRRDLRSARGTKEFSWLTSHSFRKTAATLLDQSGLTARQIANQLGHSRISLTQDVYMGRGMVDGQVAAALEEGLAKLIPMGKPWVDLRNESQNLA